MKNNIKAKESELFMCMFFKHKSILFASFFILFYFNSAFIFEIFILKKKKNHEIKIRIS